MPSRLSPSSMPVRSDADFVLAFNYTVETATFVSSKYTRGQTRAESFSLERAS